MPNNTALIVTGDVMPARVFDDGADATSATGSARADPFATDPIPPVPPLTQNEGVIVEQPVNTVIAVLQWHGPSAHADVAGTYAADVFSDVLNQPGSRFQRKLVDSGLWQSLVVNYYTLNHVGPITISGEVAPDKLRAALAALRARARRGGEAGLHHEGGGGRREAHAHRRHDGEPRARLGLRAPARVLVGGDGAGLLLRLRGRDGASRRRTTCAPTRRSTSSASRA